MRSDQETDVKTVLGQLREKSDAAHLEGMKRFGIEVSYALGIKIPELRQLARKLGKQHILALQLWETGIHEARILASMVDDPIEVTDQQIGSWVKDFNSWDLCDQVCGNLFDRTPFVLPSIHTFTASEEEFIKRAGFVLMAEYAVHDKMAPDATFLKFLPIIQKEADDDRNFVKKSVSWALRQIGKRNSLLHTKAVETARLIAEQDTAATRWIAQDVLRELALKKP